MSDVKAQVVDLRTDVVALCPTEQAAYRLCINQALVPVDQEGLAEHWNISKGALNKMLNCDKGSRKRYMPRFMQAELQQICGNRAIDQWADLYAKGMLNCQRTVVDRKAELLAELKRLEQETEKLGGVL